MRRAYKQQARKQGLGWGWKGEEYVARLSAIISMVTPRGVLKQSPQNKLIPSSLLSSLLLDRYSSLGLLEARH